MHTFCTFRLSFAHPPISLSFLGMVWLQGLQQSLLLSKVLKFVVCILQHPFLSTGLFCPFLWKLELCSASQYCFKAETR